MSTRFALVFVLSLSLGAAACSNSAGGGSGTSKGTIAGADAAAKGDELPDGGSASVTVKTSERAQICGKLSACVNDYLGIGGCVADLAMESALSGLNKIFSSWYKVAANRNGGCMLKAQDCAAVFACLNDGVAPAECSSSSYTEHCEGGKLLDCTEVGTTDSKSYVFATSCSTLGQSCVEYSSSSGKKKATCAGSNCTVAPKPVVTCAGAKTTLCSQGVQGTFDCGQMMATCAPGEFDDFPCVGTGAACTKGQVDTCNGTVATSCLNGKAWTFDCGKVGQVCKLTGSSGSGAVPMVDMGSGAPMQDDAGSQSTMIAKCDKPDGDEWCDATSGIIHFPAIEGPATLDCKAMGFKGCKGPSSPGSSGSAACVP